MPTISAKQKVYVMQHELGPVKIGIAEDPEQRCADLQISCPFEITLKQSKGVSNAHEIEKFLHKRFSKHRMRGEWFDIPPNQRDFEIPTQILDSGEADTEIKTSPDRDMEAEWADALTRFFDAMQATKYDTFNLKLIRAKVESRLGKEDPKTRQETQSRKQGVEISDLKDDIPSGKLRCSLCGHTYDRSDGSCPTCAGDASVEPRQF